MEGVVPKEVIDQFDVEENQYVEANHEKLEEAKGRDEKV
jgi:hypothetical protein